MVKAKYLGIWMDHSIANLMEFANNSMDIISIKTKFTHEEKEHSLSMGENKMHVKEQHQQGEYYKEIGEAILNYEEVVLFGPTNAKVELLNLLKKDHHFDDLKIEVVPADKMTVNQQIAFVKEYFSKH